VTIDHTDVGGTAAKSYTRATEVRSRRIRWLYKGRLAVGYLAVWTGVGDIGKSMFAAWVLKGLTLGELQGEFYGSPQDVLILATEDGREDMWKPRLVAVGADVEHVSFINTPDAWNLRDGINTIGAALDGTSAVLVFIDAAMEHMPPARGGENVNSPTFVRGAMGPLARLSRERKRSATDRVMAEVAKLCRDYHATVYTDQHESQAVTARLREKGLVASVVAMTRETKYLAFRELRDRLYDGSLVLPENLALFDELARVQSKIVEGSPYPKIILPRSAHGHCDMTQSLALAAFQTRYAQQTYKAQAKGGTLLSSTVSSEEWAATRGRRQRGGPPGEPGPGDGAGYTARQQRPPQGDDFNIMTDPF
jgi:hypothetical protein